VVDRFPYTGRATARNRTRAETSVKCLLSREDAILPVRVSADSHFMLMRALRSLSGLHARINSAGL
jgi:hypothetical protein